MVLKELVLNSLENLDSFYVNDKPLTDKTYGFFANYAVKNYYLDFKDNKAVMYVNLEYYMKD